MGQQQSNDRLLYQYVVNADIDGIQFLSKQGASLEWKDNKGKTPLIVAANDPGLYDVAETLIALGANVDAFFKGSHGGTPLHYAANKGLGRTVALLLSHGANAFVKNHENRTPLDVARKNGRNLVVREIEGRICYFTGYIREAFGPGFSDASAPQMSSRVIWVVVVPRSLHKPPKRPELELVIYSTPEDAGPRRIVLLGRAKIKQPIFDQLSPALIIFDKKTKTRYKFSSVSYSDKHQLRRLYNACKGISQVKPAAASTLQINTEQRETTTQTTEQHRNSRDNINTINSPTPTSWRKSPIKVSPPMTPNNSKTRTHDSPRNYMTTTQPGAAPPETNVTVIPSAPPLKINQDATSSCVVCWEAPAEAACVPCGHVSGCMSCLQEIKDKNGGCPVCRAHIHQVMKLYGV